MDVVVGEYSKDSDVCSHKKFMHLIAPPCMYQLSH